MMDTMLALFNDPNIIMGLGESAKRILTVVGTIGMSLVGIALIFSIVKDAMGYIKGSGSNSIGKIIGKVILLIVMIGIIAVTIGSGWQNLGENAAKKGENAVNQGLSDTGF